LLWRKRIVFDCWRVIESLARHRTIEDDLVSSHILPFRPDHGLGEHNWCGFQVRKLIRTSRARAVILRSEHTNAQWGHGIHICASEISDAIFHVKILSYALTFVSWLLQASREERWVIVMFHSFIRARTCFVEYRSIAICVQWLRRNPSPRMHFAVPMDP
jgi:hypothetical protein